MASRGNAPWLPLPNKDGGAMKYNPEIHNRHSIRLKGYDYSHAGACVVTICAQNRTCLFGETRYGGMVLNVAGEMVYQIWEDLSSQYFGVET